MSESEDIEYVSGWQDTEKFQFDLCELKEENLYSEQGGLKSYHASETGGLLYYSEKPDHHISVDRLLWVNGWEHKKGDTNGQAMTLVVLKGLFTSATKKDRIKAVYMTLKLEGVGGAKDPIVEAWAPFHTHTQWNESVAQRKSTVTNNASGTLGLNSSSVVVGTSHAHEASWDQTDFDEGQAWQLYADGKSKGYPHGIAWKLHQNDLQNHGVTPELRVAVLFAHQSPSGNEHTTYKVRFSLKAEISNKERITDGMQSVFGLSPHSTKVFQISPSTKPLVNREGHDILEHIDLNNLGELRDPQSRTQLNIKGVSATPQLPRVLKDGPVIADEAAQSDQDTQVNQTRLAELEARMAQWEGSTLPQQFDQPGHVDQVDQPYQTRLVALEARMAQLEARLAVQDSTILQLQMTLHDQRRAKLGS
ncbi:hypothetical protein N7451_004134 [Penicillium sp. IBT 35674x]|nr:hypothetical protein N7451_004134 [Penicillium sp. IBT 35674x]